MYIIFRLFNTILKVVTQQLQKLPQSATFLTYLLFYFYIFSFFLSYFYLIWLIITYYCIIVTYSRTVAYRTRKLIIRELKARLCWQMSQSYCVAVRSKSESVALMSLIFLTNASEVQFKYDTRKNYRYYNTVTIYFQTILKDRISLFIDY